MNFFRKYKNKIAPLIAILFTGFVFLLPADIHPAAAEKPVSCFPELFKSAIAQTEYAPVHYEQVSPHFLVLKKNNQLKYTLKAPVMVTGSMACLSDYKQFVPRMSYPSVLDLKCILRI